MSINVKAREAYQMLEAGVVYPDMDMETLVHISESHTALSIATSLKRIADVLTGAEIPSALHFGLQDLAYSAGLSFKQGMNMG